MGETSFARRALEERGKVDWRRGIGGDNAGGVNTLCLSLRAKDGRQIDGFSMSLYKRHYWIDDGGPLEKLVVLFSEGGVYVEGLYIKPKVEALFEQGKLAYFQEHDSTEIEMIRAHNLDHREPDKKEPTVVRVLITPTIEEHLQTEKHLQIIAAALKGEDEQ